MKYENKCVRRYLALNQFAALLAFCRRTVALLLAHSAVLFCSPPKHLRIGGLAFWVDVHAASKYSVDVQHTTIRSIRLEEYR